MWTSFGCTCGRTFMPIIYEAGSVHMDQHIFDQWSVSHAIWGFVLGWAYTAPVAAWRVGLLFVLWELWENVVEVAFSTYSPGEYHGDSFVNSFFDMVPSVTGVLLGRHAPRAWPLVALAELIATRHGFGVHSVFLGHQGSICDLRTEPLECGKACCSLSPPSPQLSSHAQPPNAHRHARPPIRCLLLRVLSLRTSSRPHRRLSSCSRRTRCACCCCRGSFASSSRGRGGRTAAGHAMARP